MLPFVWRKQKSFETLSKLKLKFFSTKKLRVQDCSDNFESISSMILPELRMTYFHWNIRYMKKYIRFEETSLGVIMHKVHLGYGFVIFSGNFLT